MLTGRQATASSLLHQVCTSSGHIYRFDGAAWSALRDLPTPELGGIRELINRTFVSSSMRDGSRGQWLNDQLCSYAAACSIVE